MKFSDSQSEATIAMILGAISSHKMDHTRWKGMKKCEKAPFLMYKIVWSYLGHLKNV